MKYIVTNINGAATYQTPGKPHLLVLAMDKIIDLSETRIEHDGAEYLHAPLYGWVRASDVKLVTIGRSPSAARAMLIELLILIRDAVDKMLEILQYKKPPNE